MSKCTCPVECNGAMYYCPSNPYYDVPLSQNPAWQQHIHDRNLASIDERIRTLEEDLKKAHEGRREYINRNNLNKA